MEFAAKSLQSCPTLCDPIDGSPPGSLIPGILQARTLEWVAISFSSAGKWKVKVKSLSCVWLFETPWTAAYQAPLSIGFSRQEYWSGVPSPSPHTSTISCQIGWESKSRTQLLKHFNKFTVPCKIGDEKQFKVIKLFLLHYLFAELFWSVISVFSSK